MENISPNSILMKLNIPQRMAASTIEGPVLILAGAGSGKTRTITHRIAYMINELKIPASSILAVSFTNKAAEEMQERVTHMVPSARLKGITLSTFHSLGVTILRSEIQKLGYHPHFTIYDTSDQLGLITEALRHYQAHKQFDRKTIQSKISLLKNKGIAPQSFFESPLFDPDNSYDLATEEVYRYYEEKMKFYNAIDFDDILFLTVKLFRNFPELKTKYSQKFRYIMVDEFQDTNPLQFELILALTECHDNLCVVGDDDQSIYAFRGADISNILGFEKNFKNTTVVKLEENYRSTMPILKLANEIIKQNKKRKDKSLWSKKESNQMPLLWQCADEDHEVQTLAEEIHKYKKSGGLLSDIAILYRSNTQVPPLEEVFRMENIPYTLIGGQKFFEKKEVKDLIAYLSCIQNPYDEISLRRILNVPARGIGPATLEKYLLKREESKTPLFEVMLRFPGLDPSPRREMLIREFTTLMREAYQKFKEMPLPAAIRWLLATLDFNQFIEDSHGQNFKQIERRKKDIEHFVESAERFCRFAAQDNQKVALRSFLERVLLVNDNENKDKEKKGEDQVQEEPKVTLLTLHSAKGLEFPIVYLIGAEEELLPHKKSILEGDSAALEEERRLFYVGVTRAQEKLVMLYASQRKLYGKDNERFPSRFLIGLEQFYKIENRSTFEHLAPEEALSYKSNFLNNLISQLGKG
jgi:superfamily I DNA/RNA helicase